MSNTMSSARWTWLGRKNIPKKVRKLYFPLLVALEVVASVMQVKHIFVHCPPDPSSIGLPKKPFDVVIRIDRNHKTGPHTKNQTIYTRKV